MADEKNRPKTPHHVILEDRSFLTVSGVSDIDALTKRRQFFSPNWEN